ncbi:MAG: TolC family protein [Acidobacteria bacterium]|nr:TolC family protein [Acidobacteriota bacterium]
MKSMLLSKCVRVSLGAGLAVLATAATIPGQSPAFGTTSVPRVSGDGNRLTDTTLLTGQSGPTATMGAEELVNMALTRNAELLAARQRVAESEGLLLQAGFHPNPGFELSLTDGSLLGSPGERELTVGYAHTFELGGKRARRVEVAQLAAELARLEIEDRERQLKATIRARYGEALAAMQNLDTAVRLVELNQQSFQLTQLRVREGEAAPVEQGLLQVELGRIEADRLLFENQLARALLKLKTLAGMNLDESLRLGGSLHEPPVTLQLAQAIDQALNARPDLKAARLEERLTGAEVRLARSEAVPNMIGFARYTRSKSRFDQFGLNGNGSLAAIQDTDNLLTTGLSITLPARNRNQGSIQAAAARQEAATQRRRFVEQVVRREVSAAYRRFEAARGAVEIFDQRVIGQSQENLRIIRGGYDLGELRLLDVINEQRRLIDTQKAYTEVLKEQYQAQVELTRAVGGPFNGRR